MHVLRIMLLLVCCNAALVAQQRYLVSPNDEVIPLRKGEQASAVIAKRTGHAAPGNNATCGNQFTFGYPEYSYPATSNFGARHKDVMAQWFVAKANGTIDTIFWRNLGSVGALDSTLYLRIMESKIGPDYGPGIRPGPYNPPCQNWGYWRNTNDLDQGIAPFADMATDTTWVSTYYGSTPSLPPFGSPLTTTDIPVIAVANQINSVALANFGPALQVQTGDKFFITLRIKGPATHPAPLDDRTEFATSGFRASTTDENYPARLWKFYEHDSGPSNCAGMPVNEVKRGWVARGGFGDDTLDVAAWNVWYSMTVTSNVPPEVMQATVIHNTLDLGDQRVVTVITDCDPANPESAGVRIAAILWQRNGIPQPDIYMSNGGGDMWSGTIPGQPGNTTISYKVYACDSSAACSYGPPISYKVVELGNQYYSVETTGVYVAKNIRSTGTHLDGNNFYTTPQAPVGTNPKEDGTYGPIDLGSNMIFFGDTNRFVWVGIDGAIALSNNATDTVDINSNGFYTDKWDFPEAQVRRGGRSDTNGMGRMPRNFIAPFSCNLNYGDEVGPAFGWIGYQSGFNGDSCLFIVEWDSMNSLTGYSQFNDEITFRLCLNTCDGTIEYQWDHVGYYSRDSLALVGMQKDSSAYVFVNKFTYPYQTKPRNNWSIKFIPTTPTSAIDQGKMIPKEFALFQNYPNPFNPTTIIRYQLPVGTQVVVRLFDVMGREVRTLVHARQEAGNHEIEFGTDGLSSGMYFYTLRAGSLNETRKMLLIR